MRFEARFAGRTAIVTGGAQGIGRAIASRLAAEGARLVIADVLEERLSETAAMLKEEAVQPPMTFTGDLSRSDVAAHLAERAIEEFGVIDVLVNNAGGGVILPTLEHTDETIATTLDRNLLTALHSSRAALPHMVEREYGRIVNLGAESVRNGLFHHAIYNAAKGGVHGMTTGLAREFAPYGITVNAVAPAGTMTEQLQMMRDREEFRPLMNATLSLIPLGRFADMEEVAALVAFLASEEAGYITGQTISVNGGSSML